MYIQWPADYTILRGGLPYSIPSFSLKFAAAHLRIGSCTYPPPYPQSTMTTDVDQVPIAGPSSGRTSGRVKNKSQRALESEDTLKLVARARERARLAAEGGGPEQSASGGKRRISKREAKGKREERESWCLCESSESSGPMIECGGCNDWYVNSQKPISHPLIFPHDQPPARLILLSGTILLVLA